jgi:hypothetical protein
MAGVEGLTGTTGEDPVAFVDAGVVVLAEEDEVVGVGGPPVDPVDEVVSFEVAPPGAAGELAGAIADHEGAAETAVDEAVASSEVQRCSVLAEDRDADAGVATEAAGGLWMDGGTEGQLTGPPEPAGSASRRGSEGAVREVTVGLPDRTVAGLSDRTVGGLPERVVLAVITPVVVAFGGHVAGFAGGGEEVDVHEHEQLVAGAAAIGIDVTEEPAGEVHEVVGGVHGAGVRTGFGDHRWLDGSRLGDHRGLDASRCGDHR